MAIANAAGKSSAMQLFMQNENHKRLNDIFRNRGKDYSWSILDSTIVDRCTDQELRAFHIPKPSEFSPLKRIRRNIYIFLTFNGSLVNWYFFLQPAILASFTGVFIMVFSDTIQTNGRRILSLKTETIIQAEQDAEYLIQITLACIGGIILTYSLPKLFSMVFNQSDSNRQRRQQFMNLMYRILQYDPFSNMHELDYNSNVDPVCAYLWFLYYDFCVNLTIDLLKKEQKKSRKDEHLPIQGIHPIDCDCIRDYPKQYDYGLFEEMGYNGALLCRQKIDVTKVVVETIITEFPEKDSHAKFELLESLCLMSIEAYNDVLSTKNAGAFSTMLDCIKRFSIQPPRGRNAYFRN